LADQQPDTTELRVELAAVSAMRRQQMGADAPFIDFIDRMRRDIATQRERARQRGLLDLTGLGVRQ